MSDRREERRRYENDIAYEVWRSGGNPDRISDERIDDCFYSGDSVESAARHELKIQRPRHEEELFPESDEVQS